jgi:uncharacterized protein (DUF1015 family)
MVEIKPFRAIRYTEKAGDLKNLITQPYDKIDSNLRKEYYEKSAYNYCRLILPMEEDRYKVAQQRIQKWIHEGILAKDKEPAFFVCRQEFKLFLRTYVRTGLIAALRLYSYGENVVFPHEITYGQPKADRLQMLRTVQKDLEPVFLIFSDDQNKVSRIFLEATKAKPLAEVQDSFGVKHSVWRVTDQQKIEFLHNSLKDKTLVITDGHHRYESAIAYRDEKRKQDEWTENSAFNFHMSYLVPVQDEGLVVLPTHRLLKKLSLTDEIWQKLREFFVVSEVEPKVEALESFLESHKNEHAFCIYDGSKAYGLLLKSKKRIFGIVNSSNSKMHLLDVMILRDVVFKTIMKAEELKIDEDILYTGATRSAIEKVDSGEAKLAFLVNCISPETVWQIAQEHQRLPEKSTDFYPKPVSGLMMMDISPREEL